MRITRHTQLYRALAYLRQSQEALAATEREAATGKRIRTVSDDPLGVALMRLDRRLRATEPFRRNSGNSSGPTGTVGFTNGVNRARRAARPRSKLA